MHGLDTFYELQTFISLVSLVRSLPTFYSSRLFISWLYVFPDSHPLKKSRAFKTYQATNIFPFGLNDQNILLF